MGRDYILRKGGIAFHAPGEVENQDKTNLLLSEVSKYYIVYQSIKYYSSIKEGSN